MILVVDDHPDTVAFLCRFLTRKGFETACASNGAEALELIKSTTPQLIILDLQMPVMDGLQLLEQMSGDDHLRTIPVIMYSAGHEKSQMDKALRLGAKAFMVKGAIGLSDLMAKIGNYVNPRAE